MSRLLLCISLFVVMSPAVLWAEEMDFPYPPTISLEDVRTYVDEAPKSHPRLFATAEDFEALRDSLDEDPAKRALADAVVQQADWLIDVPPVERIVQGKRLLDQSRRAVRRVITLAMAYQLTGEKKYAERAEKEMLAAAAFEDWNPSHFLDVGEMTFALAVGYDWLFDELAPESRETIRQAIIEKGVVLPFETRHKGWVRATNNWGQVCHGGLTAGALAVMEDEPELAAKTVHNMLHNIPRSMAAFAPNGCYPEGPGYWSYGTSYNVVLIGVVESALGTDFGLTKAPGFSITGQYLPLVTGPSQRTFNYADGGDGRGPEMALFWLAKRFDRQDWLIGERERLISYVGGAKKSDVASSRGRLMPLALFWIEPEDPNAEIKMPLHWSSEGPVPITVHRSSWTDPNHTFVGLKAGSPSAPHGQMDTGSFVLDACGKRWAVDLGAEGYHGIESRGMNLWSSAQNSDRWTIFRQMNHGHNTLVIDDQLQVAAGKAPVEDFSDHPSDAYAGIDMTSVYKGQVDLAMRGVRFPAHKPGCVVLIDVLEGLKPGAKVRWGMITPAEVDRIEEGTIYLKQGGEELMLEAAIREGSDVKWQVIDTETPRNEWDSPNRGTRMIAFEVTAPESGKMGIVVGFTPKCAE